MTLSQTSVRQRTHTQKDLAQHFQRSAQQAKTWQDYRRSVARLIDHSTRTRKRRAAEFRTRAWKIAGKAWAKAHPQQQEIH